MGDANDSNGDEDGKVVRLDFGKAQRAKASEDDPWAAQKLQAFQRLIDEGMVLVNLDARRPGVGVPSHHRSDPQLGLNFSHRFYVPDFEYDERGVRASLSFRGEPFFCEIPWSAVFMLKSHVTDEVFLFPSSVPPELEDMLHHIQAQLAGQERGSPARDAGEAPTASLAEAGFSRHDAAAATDDDSSAGSGPDDDDDDPDDGGPRLKLVKG